MGSPFLVEVSAGSMVGKPVMHRTLYSESVICPVRTRTTSEHIRCRWYYFYMLFV